MSATPSISIQYVHLSPRPASRVWAALRGVLTAVAVIAAFLAVWEAGVRAFGIRSFILPPPTSIYETTVEVGWDLLGHVQATLFTILGGFLLAILISFPLAIAISSSRLLSNAIYPLLVIKQSIPVVALAPILIVILGPNEAARITITLLIALFPLVVSTATGLSATPVELLELSKSMDASWWKRLKEIRMPCAVPYIFSGLKVSMTLSAVGAVVSEFVAAERGLGYLIYTSTAYFRLSLAYGAMLVLSFIGLLLFQSVIWIERWFFPWAVGKEIEAV
jgi:NitT/TauT family transport system permease protein